MQPCCSAYSSKSALKLYQNTASPRVDLTKGTLQDPAHFVNLFTLTCCYVRIPSPL